MSSKDPLVHHLKIILNNHVEEDIVKYIRSMKHEPDLEEFMENIVDRNNTAHMNSYRAIQNIIFGKKANPAQRASTKQTPVPTPVQIQKPSDNRGAGNNLKGGKGKKKFSNIQSFEEKKKKVEGRQECNCEGQEHEFMNNCLNCGRIFCYEEGPGPCFFCKEPVSVMGDEMFDVNSRKMNNKQKNTKPKENKVFDDDNDYFKADEKFRSTDKKKMVIALDFASRRVIESTEEDVKIKEKLHDDIKKHLDNVEKLYKKMQKNAALPVALEGNNDLVDLLIQMRHKKPMGIENLGQENPATHVIDYGKIYDEVNVANTDHGLCMSMHQPYASLLVAGVKKHEGRVWKTNHRGRLWIAAAAKVPDEEEIGGLETFYRQYYDDQTLKFPRDYPTSCLLGCVFVEDCLDQETYRQQYPNGESSSPYVLICSNPIILPIFYPIVGQHKIYPLDKELHNCAKLSIRHATYGAD